MRQTTTKRFLLGAAVATLAATLIGAPAQSQEPKSIRIGWAISKTGPYAIGASITMIGAYKTWIKDVNDAGGIMLKSVGKKVPIEVVEYDDRSNSDELVKALERLATQDKVDFILPPWGTAFNLAAGPILNRYGYPALFVTAATDRAEELAKRWPNSIWMTGTETALAEGVVETLAKLRADGKINENVAMVSVADQFGIELSKKSRDLLAKKGFKLVYDKSYPLGSQDLQPLLTDAMRSGADTFLAASYPPDTLALTEQAQILNYNPKAFFVGVGAAFPIFKQKFKENADGVLGLGGVNADLQPFQDYVKRHKEVNNGMEPDRWANPITYSTLQMLQQSIERVGKIDRDAVIKELRAGTFDTVLGKIHLGDGVRKDGWTAGQWQNGEFYAVWPSKAGAKPVVAPKPAWKKL